MRPSRWEGMLTLELPVGTGRKILNEHIALAVLGTYGAIAVSQMGGSKQATPSASPDAKAANQPPINASSS